MKVKKAQNILNVVWWQLLLITVFFGYLWLSSDKGPLIMPLMGLVTAMLVTVFGVIISRKGNISPERQVMKIAGTVIVLFILPLWVLKIFPVKGFVTFFFTWFLVITLMWQWRTNNILKWPTRGS